MSKEYLARGMQGMKNSYFEEAKSAILLFNKAKPAVACLSKQQLFDIANRRPQNQNLQAAPYSKELDMSERSVITGLIRVATSDVLGASPQAVDFFILNSHDKNGQDKCYLMAGAEDNKTLIGNLPVREIGNRVDSLKMEIFNGGDLPAKLWQRDEFIMEGKNHLGYSMKISKEGEDLRQTLISEIVCSLAMARLLGVKVSGESVFLPDKTLQEIMKCENIKTLPGAHLN